jgi:predicted metalloprotease with PDZ domain
MAAILEIIRVLFIALVGALVEAAAGSQGVVSTPGDLPDLSYSIAYEDGELPALSVGLSFEGDHDGDTTVSLPENWGGITDHAADVQAITAVTDSPAATPVRVVADGPRTWRIVHAPGERVRCSYRIVPAGRDKAVGGNDYRTAVSPDLVQVIGHLALVYPDHLRTSDPRSIALDLKGLSRPGWAVASSFGAGPDRRLVRMPGEQFLHSTIIAGRGRLIERAIGVNRVGVYVQDDGFDFDRDHFADLCSTIISTERDFFADHTDPWFLVTMVPRGSVASGGYSLGGTGLTNAFALYCNAGISLEPGSGHLAPIQRLLAHEYMHTWIGGKISPAPPASPDREPLHYWFTEGFTDFFARRVLYSAGLWTDQQYATDLSDSLGRYDQNPERDAPNARIADAFWTDPNVRELPYRRGDLVALALDERIRADSAGGRSLDTFLRDVLTRAVQNGVHPDEASLVALMASYTDDAFAARMQTFIENGGEPPIPDHTTAPALTLSNRSMQTSDPGFDVEATRQAKVITGVVEGSGAHRAGLADGMTLVSFRMDGGAGGPPKATAVVKDAAGAEQTVTYDAVSPPRTVRAYVPAG